jgi:hypothetical protein
VVLVRWAHARAPALHAPGVRHARVAADSVRLVPARPPEAVPPRPARAAAVVQPAVVVDLEGRNEKSLVDVDATLRNSSRRR